MEQSVDEREEEKEEYSQFILKACHMIMEHKTLIQVRQMYCYQSSTSADATIGLSNLCDVFSSIQLSLTSESNP